jgi:hypothetical protein
MSGYPQVIRAVDLKVDTLASAVLPGFCTVVFAVALLHVLFLSEGAQGLFRDSDTGWHILNGEAILNTVTLPRIDTFSYTHNGRPWFAWEWLSDVWLGIAHRVAGLSGVAVLAGFSIALMAWGFARLSLSFGANLFFTAGAAVIMLGTTSIHWLARPHVFSWLFALVFLACAEHRRFLYALPIVACIWANMHGSFLLGPGILFVYGVGFTVAEVIDRRQSSSQKIAAGYRPPLQFYGASLLCLLATFVNPYGWHLHDHVFTYLQTTYLMDHIAEFRSFSFHSDGAWYVEAFLMVAFVGTLALLKQRRFGPALLAFGLLHMALYSARHLPTAAVLLLPLSAAALTREARTWPSLQPMLDYSVRLRVIDQRIRGVVPMILVVLLAVAARDRDLTFDPQKFPVRAANFLPGEGRVFTKDQWGGYLIYRFAGQRKVFIDGRSDFYGQTWLQTYAQVADVQSGWQTVLNQYDVRVVMMPGDHALVAALQLSPNWKRIYTDSVAVIFARAG